MLTLIIEISWLVLIILLSILGNCMVLYIIIKHLQLRTVTNEFIVALSIGDLLSAVICMPLTIATTVRGTWISSPELCIAHGTLISIFGIHSTIIIMIITIERYFSVVRTPNKSLSLEIAWIIIAVVILISILFSIPWSVIQNPNTVDTYYNINYHHCMYNFHAATAPNGLAFSVTYMLMCYFVPFGAMATSTWLMRRMIHQNDCRIQPASSCPQQLRFSGEIRTAVTVIIMVLLLLLTRGPYLLFGIFSAISGHPISKEMDTAALWLYWTSCAINPIVYAFRNPNVGIILNIRRSSLGYRADNTTEVISTVSGKIPLVHGVSDEQDRAVEVDNVSISTVSIPSVIFITDNASRKCSIRTTGTTI